MERINLGRSGLRVSRICLGMGSYGDPAVRDWYLGPEAAEPFVKAALEFGINFFDTANLYSFGASEQITGQFLKKYARRDDVVVATKVYGPDRVGAGENEQGLSRKSILGAIDRSLTRLGMDFVDLYQIHRFDPRVPIEETMEALHDVVRAGKARYLGASTMASWQLAHMQEVARREGFTQFISMQNHYNLLYREEEREMLPLCRDEGIGVNPWSPLARGLLARPPEQFSNPGTTRSDTDPLVEHHYGTAEVGVVRRVREVATELGVGQSQVALAWLLAQPGVVAPTVGATRLEQLEAAVGAVDVRLDADHCARLTECYVTRPVIE